MKLFKYPNFGFMLIYNLKILNHNLHQFIWLFPSSHYCGQCKTCLNIKKVYVLQYLKHDPRGFKKPQNIISIQTRHKIIYYLVRVYYTLIRYTMIENTTFKGPNV